MSIFKISIYRKNQVNVRSVLLKSVTAKRDCNHCQYFIEFIFMSLIRVQHNKMCFEIYFHFEHNLINIYCRNCCEPHTMMSL